MLIRKSTLFCLFWLCLCCACSNAKTLKSGHVVKIIDGDSIVVDTGFKTLEVRLWGIDTPEYRQAYSKASKKYTIALLENSDIDLVVKDWDDYGRMVAMVKMGDGRYANEELVKAGYAWVHTYYCKEPVCREWKKSEKLARLEQRGLWRGRNPIAPWVWKRKHRGEK